MTTRTVRDVMTKGAINVRADLPLSEAARLLDTYRISGVPVVDREGYVVEERQIHRLVVVADDGRRPIGMLSISDVVHEMARQ
ncbi:MAG TPA: CBS domain-containing protein [Candidatus Limnocylindria bacterium]|nr:CBS domain-containing protein [Candidatus Limnocylindria bacterium]